MAKELSLEIARIAILLLVRCSAYQRSFGRATAGLQRAVASRSMSTMPGAAGPVNAGRPGKICHQNAGAGRPPSQGPDRDYAFGECPNFQKGTWEQRPTHSRVERFTGSGIRSMRAEVRSQSTGPLLRTYCLSVRQEAIHRSTFGSKATINEPGLSPTQQAFSIFAGCRVALIFSASGTWANRADHFRYR